MLYALPVPSLRAMSKLGNGSVVCLLAHWVLHVRIVSPLAAHPGHPDPTNLTVGELAGLATERHSARLSLRNAGKPNPPLSFCW